MRMVKGTPASDSQKGLKPSLASQNYFLPCSCSADREMEVILPDAASFRFATSVSSIDRLTGEIIRLRLARPDGFQYHPGQYLTLYNAEGTGRTYSLASVPVLDPFLELHIRLVPNGRVSGWIHKDLQVGDTVSISDAIGNCFYVDDNPEQSLLLVGTGSGLAPLYGIVRDALHHGHQGVIKLYHGSGTRAGIYLQQELKQLAENHHNLDYTACVSREPDSTLVQADVAQGRATAIALQQNPHMSGWRAYICGEPAMVKDTSRALFLAGVSLKEIYSDPFIHSKP
jgi:ferredoxin-NADP reductase